MSRKFLFIFNRVPKQFVFILSRCKPYFNGDGMNCEPQTFAQQFSGAVVNFLWKGDATAPGFDDRWRTKDTGLI